MFNNGCGNDILWILILLCCCGGNGGRDCGCNNKGCGGGCDCCDLILWYLIISCCCGNRDNGCYCK